MAHGWCAHHSGACLQLCVVPSLMSFDDDQSPSPPHGMSPPRSRGQAWSVEPDLAREDVACAHCAYNLKGLDREGHCPECGTTIAETLQKNRRLATVAEIHTDLSRDNVYCVRCGYNLRGLESDGRCPECGTQIERSLRGNMLIYSDTEYIDALSVGALFIMLANIAALCAVLLEIVTAILLGIRTAGAASVLQAVESVFLLISIGLTTLGIIGYWYFSRPDPMFIGRDDGNMARKVLRVSVLVAGGLWMLNALVTLFPSLDSLIDSNVYLSATRVALFIAWIAAISTQFFSMMLYIHWLAPRIPSRAMMQRCKLYLWLLPVIFVLGLPCVFLGPLVATILYIVLLYQLRTMFQAIRAEQLTRFPDGPAPVSEAV